MTVEKVLCVMPRLMFILTRPDVRVGDEIHDPLTRQTGVVTDVEPSEVSGLVKVTIYSEKPNPWTGAEDGKKYQIITTDDEPSELKEGNK